MKIEVEAQFANRFNRELVITKDGVTISFGEMDSRSPEAHNLALDLMHAAMCLINNHEIEAANPNNK